MMQLAITNFTTIDNHLFLMTAVIAATSPQPSWWYTVCNPDSCGGERDLGNLKGAPHS